MFGANACMEQEARLQGELQLLLSLAATCSVLKKVSACSVSNGLWQYLLEYTMIHRKQVLLYMWLAAPGEAYMSCHEAGGKVAG